MPATARGGGSSFGFGVRGLLHGDEAGGADGEAGEGPAPGAGCGGFGVGIGAGGEAAEHERVRVLREIKNQIIGNRTKKLLYLRLGVVPAVVAALAEPGASPAALV